jgi:hypothetical protein
VRADRRGEGEQEGVGAALPRLPIESIGAGFALGYYLAPLLGLVRLTS